MTPHYYVREIEKILIALMDVFNNLRVNKYTDLSRTTYVKTVEVPIVTHTSDDFANWLSSTTTKQQLMKVPIAGLRYVSNSPDESNRVQPTYAREIYVKDLDFWIRDIQPTPYVFTFELEILSDNLADFFQLKENIEPYFNTYRTLRIKEFDFAPTVERPIPFSITAINDQIDDEKTDTSNEYQFYHTKYTIQCHGVMHRPYEIPAMIKYAEMNFNVDNKMTDSLQILVYPTEIAKAKRQKWETVEPSIMEGYSLLKTMARTLIRRGESNGEEYWSDETDRYAMLTYTEKGASSAGETVSGYNPVLQGYQKDANGDYVLDEDGAKIPIYNWEEVITDDVERPTEVPEFDMLHITFDRDSNEAEDYSGLGRDFIAVNGKTREYMPDMPPGSGTYAPDGYVVDENSTGRDWSQILEWFGDNSDGTIKSSYTFKATLQFREDIPGDTIFQYLYNPNDVTLSDGTVIRAGEVWFDWGVMDSSLYFTFHTTSMFKTFKTDTFAFDKETIYSFYFVLYDSGNSGAFGVKTNFSETMIALKTREAADDES